MANEKYSTSINTIDNTIIVIKDNTTQAYNITHSLKSIARADGAQPKRFEEWQDTFFDTDFTEDVEDIDNVENAYYEVDEGPLRYQGVYVPSYLYHHVLSWASRSYALQLARVADKATKETAASQEPPSTEEPLRVPLHQPSSRFEFGRRGAFSFGATSPSFGAFGSGI